MISIRIPIFIILLNLFIFLSNCKNELVCSIVDTNCNLLIGTLIQNNIESGRYRANLFFLPSGGVYEGDQFVRLSSDTVVTVRYTTDGSLPNCSSTPYTSPIQVSNSGTVIRAIACFGSRASSNGVVNQAYTIKNSIAKLSDIVFWYSAQSLQPVEGARVTALKDLSFSGNRNDLISGSQVSSSLGTPVIKTNTVNGQSSIVFSNANKTTLLTQNLKGITNVLQGALALVIKKSTNSVQDEPLLRIGSPYTIATGSGLATAGFSGTRNFEFRNSSNQFGLCSQNNNCSVANSNAIPLNKVIILLISFNGNSITYSIPGEPNGDLSTTITGSLPLFSVPDTMVIGNFITLRSDLFTLDSEVMEIIYWNRPFSNTVDVPVVCPYLKEKYLVFGNINCGS
jgi:hypothetical protein